MKAPIKQVLENIRARKVRQQVKNRRPPAEFKIVRLRECPVGNPILENPDAVEKFWREHVATAPWFKADRECLVVFLLNTRRKLIGFEMLSQGTKDTLLVNAGEVFRLAAVRSAAAIIVAHNHPSGDPQPSEADIKITRELIRAGALLKIDLLDHVVIGAQGQGGVSGRASLKEQGYLNIFKNVEGDLPSNEPRRSAPGEADAATPARKGALLVPSHLVVDMKDALCMLEIHTQAALSLALMNANLIELGVKEHADWNNFEAPGFGAGAFELARGLSSSFALAFQDYETALKPLLARLAGCKSPVASLSLGAAEQFDTEKAVMLATGCEVKIELWSNLENVLRALSHCLRVQGEIMCDRGHEHAMPASALASEQVDSDWDTVRSFRNRLATALVAVERSTQQRAAA